MTTELKSYTIVPDSLYVERRADKQLHAIIEAMQRPGYVLVSRQMGKTNLLLRAKRKWENIDDLYVYIDMSNIDETEKECFESLIDTAIDTHEEVLSSIRGKISDLRCRNVVKSAVQAHNEELRVLLGAVKGKLVFILDEIDSLTRTSFSDNVFSQIRSVYFSRVNYPVLEKLTYVLSGVVEPTEIIKNPKISPFNIGEKILLDDFSWTEYLSFIEKADLLGFGDEVIQRIYYWAGGNPRLTWDICYELQHKTDLTPAVVDALVKEMYLTSYDKAPVDTIRSLVKEDRDLRDAVIQLAFKKGNSLSDKIKSKLYLSGVVNYSDDDIHIKNKIIEESLSLNWLQKIEEEEKGLLTYAWELHSKGLYQESILKMESYLRTNDFPSTEAPLYYYCLGSCHYHLGHFEQSLKYFTQYLSDLPRQSFEFRHAHLLSGVDCLNLRQPKQALAYFEEVLQGETKDQIYYSAKWNFLITKLGMGSGDVKLHTIEETYKELSVLPDDVVSDSQKLYWAVQLAEINGNRDKSKACEYYDAALAFADEKVKPRILVQKFKVVPVDQRPQLLNEFVALVKDLKSVEESPDPDRNLELNEYIFLRLLYLIYFHSYERWDEVRAKVSLLPYSYGASLYKMFFTAYLTADLYEEGAHRLINELHDNINSDWYAIDASSRLQIFKFHAFLNQSDDNAMEYLAALHLSDEVTDTAGLAIIRAFAWSLFSQKDYKAIVKELDWVIEKYPQKLTHQDMAIRAVIDYILMVAYLNCSNPQSAIALAQLILLYIDDELPFVTDRAKENMTYIKEYAQQVLAQSFPLELPSSTQKYGRNDWVRVKYQQSGRIENKKYKYVENDLKKGLCVVVESEM